MLGRPSRGLLSYAKSSTWPVALNSEISLGDISTPEKRVVHAASATALASNGGTADGDLIELTYFAATETEPIRKALQASTLPNRETPTPSVWEAET